MGNLSAAQEILKQSKASDETTAKLDEARRALAQLAVNGTAKSQLDTAVAAIEVARADVEADKAKLKAISTEIGAQLDHATSNLSAPTAAERAKGVKDQVLAVLWPFLIAALVLYLLHRPNSYLYYIDLRLLLEDAESRLRCLA